VSIVNLSQPRVERFTQTEEALLAAGGIRAEDLELTSESLAGETRLSKDRARRELSRLRRRGYVRQDGGNSSCGWFKTHTLTREGWREVDELCKRKGWR
jgi:predicted HTH transcriptional regulator